MDALRFGQTSVSLKSCLLELQIIPMNSRWRALTLLDLDPPTAEAIKLAIDTCSECHSFGITNAAAAPALGTVFGRPVASNGWNGYSASLAGNGGTWNAESLRRFINDPEAFAPGTTMPDPALDDEKVLTGLVTLLQAIKEEPE